jgi:hypothetical protein
VQDKLKDMRTRTLKSTSKVYDRFPDLNISYDAYALNKLTSTWNTTPIAIIIELSRQEPPFCPRSLELLLDIKEIKK